MNEDKEFKMSSTTKAVNLASKNAMSHKKKKMTAMYTK